MKKISVVMATYNGEAYVEEQLRSIVRQSIVPDEILIVDDCSTDNTVEIINNFMKKEQFENYTLNINTDNVGWKINFYQLISKCNGEIVFYCDQDDIWENDRIKIILNEFDEMPKAMCIMCDYYSIDSKGNVFDIGQEEKKCLKKISYKNSESGKAYGCLLAFKREIKNRIVEVINKGNYTDIPTDLAISRISMFSNGLYYVNQKLIRHRFHNSNVSNRACNASCLEGHNTYDERLLSLNYEIKLMGIIAETKWRSNDIESYIHFLNVRKKALEKSKIFFKEMVKIGFDYRSICICGDIFYHYKVNEITGKIYHFLKKI